MDVVQSVVSSNFGWLGKTLPGTSQSPVRTLWIVAELPNDYLTDVTSVIFSPFSAAFLSRPRQGSHQNFQSTPSYAASALSPFRRTGNRQQSLHLVSRLGISLLLPLSTPDCPVGAFPPRTLPVRSWLPDHLLILSFNHVAVAAGIWRPMLAWNNSRSLLRAFSFRKQSPHPQSSSQGGSRLVHRMQAIPPRRRKVDGAGFC
jgi:hypothetical protein